MAPSLVDSQCDRADRLASQRVRQNALQRPVALRIANVNSAEYSDSAGK